MRDPDGWERNRYVISMSPEMAEDAKLWQRFWDEHTKHLGEALEEHFRLDAIGPHHRPDITDVGPAHRPDRSDFQRITTKRNAAQDWLRWAHGHPAGNVVRWVS